MTDLSKDLNPKDGVGIRKVPLSAVPCGPLLEVGLAMMEGGRKYGRANFRVKGAAVRASVYYDAFQRHLMAWFEGQDIDPDSGLSHITKATAGLIVLRDGMLSDNWIDDRPISNPIDIAALNAKASEIIDKYPESKEPFTQKGVEKSI
jgi:hypothetical protein